MFTIYGKSFKKHNMLEQDFEMWSVYLTIVIKDKTEALALADMLVLEGRIQRA